MPAAKGEGVTREIFGLRNILLLAAALAGALALRADPLPVEKPDLKFGFIKLTDCAPLVIAKELGYFDDEFLSVTLEPQANWKILLDRVIGGELDGAHMLAVEVLQRIDDIKGSLEVGQAG